MKNKTKILPQVLLTMLLLAYALFSVVPAAGAAPPLRYYAVDVGQGDCSLFILPNGQTIVIDAGPEKNAKKTVRYLKSCGVKKVDLLVATHPHEDHIGGMRELLSAFPVEKIWDSGYNHGSRIQRDFYRAIKEGKIAFGRPKRGFSDKFGDVEVKVLAPVKQLKNTNSDANNNGLVLLVTYGDISFLMTGDMEREERATIAPLPRAVVLKAAHHGSRNGTDKRTLREVSPEIIVLSYAKGNSYGHPHKEVVRAIREAGVRRFDTADGAVKLRTDGKSITFERKRAVK
ncbi:ComEC/Rec2 family competence protein [Cloacibacillus evryensis]|uniref:ComEC/Rec2 family competence protein n=1 Tax=Cloacibacillus evryensis TaxID=508460 RepID=UPI0004484BE2|nr:MBL fold metallo-hydrolase [Cloacibacillus evryensis]EXG78325.1 putative hydrolase (metallo-beta-lactamase superfamily) [Cloacibacillus evryensis DSM 19522]MEA5035151.1 MBL fold metallo-hydrolase [Cloacibacillus evryensis]